MPGLCRGLDCTFATAPDGLHVSALYAHPCSHQGMEREFHLWFLLPEILPMGLLDPNQYSFVDDNLLK